MAWYGLGKSHDAPSPKKKTPSLSLVYFSSFIPLIRGPCVYSWEIRGWLAGWIRACRITKGPEHRTHRKRSEALKEKPELLGMENTRCNSECIYIYSFKS